MQSRCGDDPGITEHVSNEARYNQYSGPGSLQGFSPAARRRRMEERRHSAADAAVPETCDAVAPAANGLPATCAGGTQQGLLELQDWVPAVTAQSWLPGYYGWWPRRTPATVMRPADATAATASMALRVQPPA